MSLEAREPFYFFTRHNLIYLTGRKARNLKELVLGIKEASSASIYYHTHHFLQEHEYLTPEPTNDFAYWIASVHGDSVLGEQVASIDLREFFRLRDIRLKIIAVMDEFLQGNPGCDHDVPAGLEFHFMKAQTFVSPTKHIARNMLEFKECLQKVSVMSIYYHMFESRLRLQRPYNDFSYWLLDSFGENSLAEKFQRIDPYTYTLDNLRQTLIGMLDKRINEETHDKP